ncbi:MAG: hypothetical protein QOC98_3163 [Frankiaceae bacterium]|nr:hypothetical protein [Frankiaceae bacterium]
MSWWQRDVVEPGKLPLMLCFTAFVVTFVVTRGITRAIRAGRGPFRDNVGASGVHVHHAVPGIVLLIVGALVSVGTAAVDETAGTAWSCVGGVLVGIGMSLVLDEFALILHLSDVYWQDEGRLSVDIVSLAAAFLGLVLLGFSPFGVNGVGHAELAVRLTAVGVLLLHGALLLTCVLKRKFGLALFGLLLPLTALYGAVRLARPGSAWARRRYDAVKTTRAVDRAVVLDRRWGPRLRRWQDLVGGAVSPVVPVENRAGPTPAVAGSGTTDEPDGPKSEVKASTASE